MPRTALVLDDIDSCRTLLTDLLLEKQIHVRAFSSPLECLMICRQCADSPCADFILTDNKMPGMTGMEFLEKINSLGCKIPDNRKAVISGIWTAEDVASAEQSGFTVFRKPYFIDVIYRWLGVCKE